MAEEKVTPEQAEGALRELLSGKQEAQDTEEPAPAPDPETTPKVEEPEPDQPAEAEEPEPDAGASPETEAASAPEGDDIVSLRKRIEEGEAKRKADKDLFDARWKAVNERGRQNEDILRKRLLTKSSIVDRARTMLERLSSDNGPTQVEVDRLLEDIRGTMNPASPSYVPPPQAQHADLSEDHIITLNAFLNEHEMTAENADRFGRWLQGDGRTVLTPQEQAIADQSLDGFLRIAHRRWSDAETEADKKKRQADAVEAVKTIQKTQRLAAKAGAATPRAPTKTSTPAPSKPAKLSKDDVSALLRQTVLDGDRF